MASGEEDSSLSSSSSTSPDHSPPRAASRRSREGMPPLPALRSFTPSEVRVCAACGAYDVPSLLLCHGCERSCYCGVHCQVRNRKVASKDDARRIFHAQGLLLLLLLLSLSVDQAKHWDLHVPLCRGDQQVDEPTVTASTSGLAEGGEEEIVSSCLRVPIDLMTGQLLYFLDAVSLAHFSMASKATQRMVVPRHWEMLHRCSFEWLYPFKPLRRDWKDLVGSLLMARKMSEQGMKPRGRMEEDEGEEEEEEEEEDERLGKIYVFGGSNTRPLPLRMAVKFFDEGPGDYRSPKTFHKAAIPRLSVGRSAAAVVRDHHERLCVMGGWSGDEALSSFERYCPDFKEWEWVTPLATPRCFHAAAVDGPGRVFALGGGESIWQGAAVFSSTEYLDPVTETWHAGPAMREARCGLAAAVTSRGHICVAGGYGGGQTYLSSAEYLPCDGRGWQPLPPMAYARTGFGLCYGPDGCLYAVGGSPNGAESHRSVERFDERRGVWETLPHLVAGRSYCGAAFGVSGLLYVAGGQASSTADEDGMLLQSVECFDPRAHKWTILPKSDQDGIRRVDLSLQFSLV